MQQHVFYSERDILYFEILCTDRIGREKKKAIESLSLETKQLHPQFIGRRPRIFDSHVLIVCFPKINCSKYCRLKYQVRNNEETIK